MRRNQKPVSLRGSSLTLADRSSEHDARKDPDGSHLIVFTSLCKKQQMSMVYMYMLDVHLFDEVALCRPNTGSFSTKTLSDNH